MKSNLYMAIKCLVVCAIFTAGTAKAQNQVTVKQQIPEVITAGDDFDVTFTVNKDNVQSFARLQHNLPPGFKARIKNGKNYHAILNGNKAKLVWVSLPNDKEFQVTYNIKVSRRVAGEFKLGGQFDFVANNVKTYSIIEPANITVMPNALADLGDDEEGEESTPVGGSTAYDVNIFDN